MAAFKCLLPLLLFILGSNTTIFWQTQIRFVWFSLPRPIITHELSFSGDTQSNVFINHENNETSIEYAPTTIKHLTKIQSQNLESLFSLFVALIVWYYFDNKQHKGSLFMFAVASMTIITANAQYTGWTSISSPPLPRTTMRAAIGYSDVTDSIWIKAGHDADNSPQLVSFKDNLFTDHGASNLSFIVKGQGQFYVQIEHYLWMIATTGTSFIRFNVRTAVIEYNYNAITIQNVGEFACLTGMIDSDGHQFLIVVGGDSASKIYLNKVQILNLTNNTWLSNVPAMQTKRRSLSCEVVNEYVYAFGGRNGAGNSGVIQSIEKLYVGDVANVQAYAWSFFGNLLSRLRDIRSVVYGDHIIVLGGVYSANYNININVINTVSNTITSGGFLSYGAYGIFPIIAYPYIYSFGGWASCACRVNKWQYHILPTVAPSLPTIYPTIEPTEPTMEPTIEPTFNPTIEPTIEPTFNPTIKPTFDSIVIPVESMPDICSDDAIGFIETAYQLSINSCLRGILKIIENFIEIIDKVYYEYNLFVHSNITESQREQLSFIDDTYCGNITIHIVTCFNETVDKDKLLNA
eukprot:241407_1